jgi:hypothetical protein
VESTSIHYCYCRGFYYHLPSENLRKFLFLPKIPNYFNKMKFQCSAIFWMLLTASASSFATTRSSYRTTWLESPATSAAIQSSRTSDRLPFVQCRGGSSASSSSKLSASVESPVIVSSENLAMLSDRGRKAVADLIENDVNGAQKHVYSDWPAVGTQDDEKRRLAEQVRG